MEDLKDIIDKISSYHIFNYLLPGTLFCFLLKDQIGYNLIQENILIGLFLYYFIGLVVSRIGSIFIEPFLKKIRFLKFADYKDFVTASQKDTKIDLLSEVNNTYRTILSMIVLLFLSKFYVYVKHKFDITHNTTQIFVAVGLLLLFLFSYRKQTIYITKRINANNHP